MPAGVEALAEHVEEVLAVTGADQVDLIGFSQGGLIAELYTKLCGRASSVGLLPEQIDPSSGEFYGNFPQAFSHIGVISAGVTLKRALAGSLPVGTGLEHST